MGHNSKIIAEYLEDGYVVEIIRGKVVKNKLKSLQDK